MSDESPAPSIRLATVEDAEAIASLIQGLAHYFLVGASRSGRAEFLAHFARDPVARCVASPDFHYVVAQAADGGELLGVAALRNDRHVHHLFVTPRCHRQGVATRLWAHLKARAMRSGHAHAVTVNSSLHAVPVYARWGFVPSADVQIRDGVSFQPMHLPVASGPTCD